MNNTATKVFLGIIAFCLLFGVIVTIHEIRAKHKYDEWVEETIQSRLNAQRNPYGLSTKPREQIEREVRSEPNPFSWLK